MAGRLALAQISNRLEHTCPRGSWQRVWGQPVQSDAVHKTRRALGPINYILVRCVAKSKRGCTPTKRKRLQHSRKSGTRPETAVNRSLTMRIRVILALFVALIALQLAGAWRLASGASHRQR